MCAPIGQRWPRGRGRGSRSRSPSASAGSSASGASDERRAARPAADHLRRERRRRSGSAPVRRRAASSTKRQKPGTSWLQLAEDEVAAVAAEVGSPVRSRRPAARRPGRRCGHERPVGEQAVLVRVAEHELAGLHGVVAAGPVVESPRSAAARCRRGSRRARCRSQVSSWRSSAHEPDAGRGTRAQARLAGAARASAPSVGVEQQQRGRPARRRAAPAPVLGRVSSDVAEHPAAVRGRHAVDELVGEQREPCSRSARACRARAREGDVDRPARRPLAGRGQDRRRCSRASARAAAPSSIRAAGSGAAVRSP